jgi:hypothetical protein
MSGILATVMGKNPEVGKFLKEKNLQEVLFMARVHVIEEGRNFVENSLICRNGS